jgi:stearoyl-CoA desaturase (delta-9 desaturase)
MWKGNLVHEGPAHEKLMQDPVIRFFERTQLVWFIFTFILPGLIAFAFVGTWGAFWQAALWAGAVRVFVMHHITWSINSICHTFGTRPYESPDVARNNGVFGWLGWGEGWHNNHHAFPKSAFLGHRWWQVDLGKYVLVTLRALRLVDEMYVPSREERAAKREAGRKARATRRQHKRVGTGAQQE